MKSFLSVLGVLIIIAAILILPRINNVPKLDEAVNAAWAQVDNQYKRRADLVPNLVATVKGYASHEKEVFTQVTEARAKVGQITLTPEMLNNPKALEMFQNAQDSLSSALSRLLAVSENYPDLKASQNFINLQAQLEGTENRIAVARKDYIKAVKDYNIELRTIPGKWVAALLYPEAEIKQTFTATPAEQKNPEVAF
ncbi:MAG: LemA family protein [Sulfurovaceae bacterium]